MQRREREGSLLRAPAAPYSMCLDTIWEPNKAREWWWWG